MWEGILKKGNRETTEWPRSDIVSTKKDFTKCVQICRKYWVRRLKNTWRPKNEKLTQEKNSKTLRNLSRKTPRKSNDLSNYTLPLPCDDAFDSKIHVKGEKLGIFRSARMRSRIILKRRLSLRGSQS